MNSPEKIKRIANKAGGVGGIGDRLPVRPMEAVAALYSEAEETRAPGTDAVANRWREQRMLHCKGLKRDTANSLWFAQREALSIIHSTAHQRLPRLLRRENGARRTIFQAPGVIGMCMRKHDRVGSQSSHSPQPVESAVDHHAPGAMPDQERRVHTMLAGPHLDLAAGA